MKIKVGKTRFAEISPEDYEQISQYKWMYLSSGYAYTILANKKRVLMHRLLMGLPLRHILVDHKNHNGLDNRRENLRLATHQQNLWNFKIKENKVGATFSGVEKRRKRWASTIRINSKRKFLGRFLTKEEAINAYKKAAAEYHGEFSPY